MAGEDWHSDVSCDAGPPMGSILHMHEVLSNGVGETRIVQLKRHESDALLEMLYRHIETPEFHCRFNWRAGSIAFWDNRAARHHALWGYHPLRRYGLRITVCGDKPFYRSA